MSERDDLLRGIVAAPDDDAPRLIYADWVEENDEHGDRLARFIRLSVRLGQLVNQYARGHVVQEGFYEEARRRQEADLQQAWRQQERYGLESGHIPTIPYATVPWPGVGMVADYAELNHDTEVVDLMDALHSPDMVAVANQVLDWIPQAIRPPFWTYTAQIWRGFPEVVWGKRRDLIGIACESNFFDVMPINLIVLSDYRPNEDWTSSRDADLARLHRNLPRPIEVFDWDIHTARMRLKHGPNWGRQWQSNHVGQESTRSYQEAHEEAAFTEAEEWRIQARVYGVGDTTPRIVLRYPYRLGATALETYDGHRSPILPLANVDQFPSYPTIKAPEFWTRLIGLQTPLAFVRTIQRAEYAASGWVEHAHHVEQTAFLPKGPVERTDLMSIHRVQCKPYFFFCEGNVLRDRGLAALYRVFVGYCELTNDVFYTKPEIVPLERVPRPVLGIRPRVEFGRPRYWRRDYQRYLRNL